jgi:thioredoxin reductase (NADPH)
VFLAPFVKRLTVLVRSKGLEASMSRYLIDRIKSLDNVTLQVRSELVELHGDPVGALESATVRDNATGTVSRVPVRQVFLFVGAEPNTSWLDGSIALDEKGYILTGLSPTDAHAPAPLPLQTSLARVFAIGDVRSGSTKRVASAVGEGAAVVAQIHSMLGAVSATA